MWRKYLSLEGTSSIAVLSVMLVVLVGCSEFAPSTPSTPASAAAEAPRAVQGDALTLPSFVQYATPISLSSSTRLIGSKGGSVSTGRITLIVPPGALTLPLPVAIASINILLEQCAVEPTGLVFSKPATLVFSYAGTNADPSSPTYSGQGALSVWWLDASVSKWKPIGGTVNATAKTVSVPLNHLSYYALAK